MMESVSVHVQVSLAEERECQCLVRRYEITLSLQQKPVCNHQFHAPNEVSIKTYTVNVNKGITFALMSTSEEINP